MKHEFALYAQNLSSVVRSLAINQEWHIEQPLLVHRVVNVLRLKKEEMFIVFDRQYHVVCKLIAYDKKTVTVVIEKKEPNTILSPSITLWLPLLKRDDLNQAIYSAVELGANEICLFTSQKVQRKWGKEKEHERLTRIMIAAAEQSKNFAFPVLHEPISFEDFIEKKMVGTQIFFDPTGAPLLSLLNDVHKTKPMHLDLLVGPEGDLTSLEKKLLQKREIMFCALTPTILRAAQAIAVGLGSFASIFR